MNAIENPLSKDRVKYKPVAEQTMPYQTTTDPQQSEKSLQTIENALSAVTKRLLIIGMTLAERRK